MLWWYALLSITDMLALWLQWPWLHSILKPLLMPALAVTYLWHCRQHLKKPSNGLLLALGLAWLGDILLLFAHLGTGFFIGGLSAFLLMQVAYARLFFIQSPRSNHKILRLSILAFAILDLVTILMVYLWPSLGTMLVPVLVYAIAISVMLFAACYNGLNRSSRHYFSGMGIGGALLFVLSDSILAIQHFRPVYDTATGDVLIMATYTAAQALIIFHLSKPVTQRVLLVS
jgi:uncharacterized membrane protein YhhN